MYSSRFIPLLQSLEMPISNFLMITAVHGSWFFFNREKCLLVSGLSYISLYPNKMVIYTYFMEDYDKKNEPNAELQRHAILASCISLFFHLFAHTIITVGMYPWYFADTALLMYTLTISLIAIESRKMFNGLLFKSPVLQYVLPHFYYDGLVVSLAITAATNYIIFTQTNGMFKFMNTTE